MARDRRIGGRIIRLDKLIADGLLVTRGRAKELIKTGRIRVEGLTAVKPETDVSGRTVTFDGKPVRSGPVYIMLNKPEGYLSATEDKHDPVALDLLPEEFSRLDLGICGRLDKDSKGLLIISDDGGLNHRITSPKSCVQKRYYALCDSPVTGEDVMAFASGIELSDFTAAPAELEPSEGCGCYITITEGKYRQIRRMLASRGHEVLMLKRLSVGGVLLDESLAEGSWRMLTDKEVDMLKKAVQKDI